MCDLRDRTDCNHKAIRVPQETRDGDGDRECKGAQREQLKLTLNLYLKPITHPFLDYPYVTFLIQNLDLFQTPVSGLDNGFTISICTSPSWFIK